MPTPGKEAGMPHHWLPTRTGCSVHGMWHRDAPATPSSPVLTWYESGLASLSSFKKSAQAPEKD